MAKSSDRLKAAGQRVRRGVRDLLQTEQERRHGLVGATDVWEQKRAFQIEFLRAEGLTPTDQLLDIGCGTLRGGAPVIAYLDPSHYTGVDVRAEALAAGLQELVDAGLEDRTPTLMLSPDLTALQLGRHFDVIWAFSVLIHMTDPIVEGALAFVAEHLAEGGTFYANVNIGSQSPRDWDRFPVLWRSMERYVEMAAAAGLVPTDLGSLRDLGHDTGNERGDAQRMLRFRACAPTS